MLKFISDRFAINTMIFLLGSTLIFHFLVIIGIIPYDIIWGGRMKTKADMISFESLSIIVNLAMLLVILTRSKFITIGNHPVKIRVALWTMTVLFTLNTLGNILAETMTEKLIFTPLTLISAILCFKLAQNPIKKA